MANATLRLEASGGYVASVVREMYGSSLPRAAQQLLRDHARTRSSSAPAKGGTGTWSTGLSERGAARKVDVKIPKVGQRKGAGPPLPPRAPPSKKPLAQILVDTGGYDQRQDLPVPSGRDALVEKRRLQDQNAFGFGGALPTTKASAGYVASMPAVSSDRKSRGGRHVSFAQDRSGSLPPSRDGISNNTGLTTEQERMAVDIVEGVRSRQRELDGVDQVLSSLVERAEVPRQDHGLRNAVKKEMVTASKRRLEFKNAIQRDMHDLEHLFDLAPADL